MTGKTKSSRSSGLLIFGGPIVTMDPACPLVEAVVSLAGRIIWSGRKIDVPRLPGMRLQRMDLQGRLMLPAFCDAHTHFLFTALGNTRIALEGALSLAGALRRIRDGLATIPRTKWVLGTGFDLNLWPAGDRPHRTDLDRIIPDRPAAFLSKDEHALWVNSAALREAGITALTPDPPGGWITRDPSSGDPTGYLRENAYRLVWNKVPPVPLSIAERAILKTIPDAYRVGVTQIHDVGSDRSFEVFQSLHLKSKLNLRVMHAQPVEQLDKLAATGLRSGLGDEFLRLGPVKVFLDGALGSHSAYLKKPYSTGRKSYGVPVYTGEEFNDIVRRAFKSGWAVAVHAIGDAAVRRALDAFLIHRRRRPGPVCSRIEHAQLIDPVDLTDFARSGVAASVQPSHLLADRDTALKHWGARRSRWAFAFRSLQNVGVPLAFGSDTPIEVLDPLQGIQAAANRQVPGDSRGPWTAAEKLSVQNAVAGFTVTPAILSGEGNLKGSITPGKVADFVTLSENIFNLPPTKIDRARVITTIFNGRVVYEEA